MSVGERIKARLQGQNKSMRWLHHRTGIPLSTLYEIRNGRLKKSTQIAVIAHALGINALWLQRGQGAKLSNGAADGDGGTLEWPFTFSAQRLLTLSEIDRRLVDIACLALVEELELRATVPVPAAAHGRSRR